MLSTTNSKNTYTGSGSTNQYDYDFKIFVRTHLLVTVANTLGEETILVIDTDYDVSGIGENDGGEITLIDNGQDWIDGDGYLKASYPLAIRRNIPFTQATDLRNQGDYYPETLEDRLDYQTMIDQQLLDHYDRAFKLPETVEESEIDTVITGDLEPLSILAVNEDGDGFVFRTASEFVADNEDFLLAAYNLSDLDDPDEALENLGLTATAAQLNSVTTKAPQTEVDTLKLALPAGDDYLQLQESASPPATPAAGYKRIYADTDGKVYQVDSAGVVRELGSGGGGAAIKWYPGDANAPTEVVLSNGLKVLSFAPLPDEQVIYCKLPVPANYVPGTQITLTGGVFCGDTAGSSDNVWFKAETIIMRGGLNFAGSFTAHTSTNPIEEADGFVAVGMATDIDLTDADGEINGSPVAPLDVLVIALYRDTSAEDAAAGISYPYNVYLLPETLQPVFS